MTKNDEQLIRQFMQDNKQEVADNGFSRRVMRRLPLRPKEISDLLTAVGVVVGCILFYVFDGLDFPKMSTSPPSGRHCWCLPC